MFGKQYHLPAIAHCTHINLRKSIKKTLNETIRTPIKFGLLRKVNFPDNQEHIVYFEKLNIYCQKAYIEKKLKRLHDANDISVERIVFF